MIFPQPWLDLHDEISVDGFAGGGGWSLGYKLATGRDIDIAMNHDADALSMHEKNHPATRHFPADIFEVDPREVCQGRRVGYSHFSPDCTDHSDAKGSSPIRDVRRRSLAWVVLRWAGEVRPRVITLENVPGFQRRNAQVAKRCKETGRVVKLDKTVAAPGEVVPLREQWLMRSPRSVGKRFRRFKRLLEAMGYAVEFRVLRACDYGAPTIRERLFMVARCDGRPIVWPTPTHGDPESAAVKAGALLPWRTAAECIDWSIPMCSIFAAPEEAKAWGRAHGRRSPKRPLAANTMRRIARGVWRFVLHNPRPFIVPVQNSRWEGGAAYDTASPFRTITAQPKGGGFALAVPVLAPLTVSAGGRAAQSAPRPGDAPHLTVTGKGDAAIVAPFLTPRYGEREGQEPRARSIEFPTPVIVPTGNGASLVAPLLTAYHAERREGEARAHSVENPAPTVDTSNRLGVIAAFLAQNNEGGYTGDGRRADAPASTILNSGSHQSVVAANLVKLRGTSSDLGADTPLGTVGAEGQHHGIVAAHLLTNTTGHAGGPAGGQAATLTTGAQQGVVAAHLTHLYGNDPDGRQGDPAFPARADTERSHAAVVYAFMATYYGTAIGQPVNDPLHTVTGVDRFGILTVEVQGRPYVIEDIGMRMWWPRELFRAQSFPDWYVIDHGHDGRVFTSEQQVRMCGNSVPPLVAAAIVRVNVPEMILPELREQQPAAPKRRSARRRAAAVA